MLKKSDLCILGLLRTAIDRAITVLDSRLGKGEARISLFLSDSPTYQFIFDAKDEIKSILNVEEYTEWLV